MSIRSREEIVELLNHPRFPEYTRRRIFDVLSLNPAKMQNLNCAGFARYVWGYSNDLEVDTPEKKREFMHFSEHTFDLPNTQITDFPEPGCLVVFGGDLSNEHYAINLNPMGSSYFSMHGIGGEIGVDNRSEIFKIYQEVHVDRWTFVHNLRPL